MDSLPSEPDFATDIRKIKQPCKILISKLNESIDVMNNDKHFEKKSNCP